MHPSSLTYIPDNLQDIVDKLLGLSPLFAALMRDADEVTCKYLFQDKAHAVLPDNSEAWMPVCDSSDMAQCMMHLRQIKQRTMRHIIWWELGIHGDIVASYQAITCVAEGLLQQAVIMAQRLLKPRFGQLEAGSFCVIGLGKLGGQELNLGSDVDPLFIWQGNGYTQGGRKSIAANEYYNYLSRMLIRLMSEYTADGVVWPVDMRLRPGGDGAPICLNLDATLSHYLEYGQTWERAMLIKARPVAGDMALGNAFVEGVKPFIYKRYLDYSSVAALAEMKRRIDIQAGSAEINAGFDVKRGHGGIREIEFIIQSMQLLHAGRNHELCLNESKAALDALQSKGFMPEQESLKLFEAYCFWRRVEHAIQARKGEQTHALPDDYASYLAEALAITDIEQQMRDYSCFVAGVFSERVLPVSEYSEVKKSWLTACPLADVKGLSEEELGLWEKHLQRIDDQLLRGLLPERSRQQVELILDKAMPHWLVDSNGLQALVAFADLLHAISGRATWVDLLATHRGALEWLIGVLSASRYLAEHIVKNPSWLEWPLLHERGEGEIHRICKLMDGLKANMDEEAFLAQLGRLVDQSRMQCALAVDAHEVEPIVMAKWMSDVADAAVRACLRSSLYQLGLPRDFPLLALALGKHGSREMGLVSDLDMVFVLAGDIDMEVNGRSAREWGQRLGRRMIRQLTGIPPFGAGYEFDARLRPSGHSGVLVTTLQAFRGYQLHEAQVWEHQALCRARVVTGSAVLRASLLGIVQEVLDIKRDRQRLAKDVLEMRQKMLEHLASKSDTCINLKHDAGGLVDIEFLAQYACLAFGTQKAGEYSTAQSLLSLPKHAPKAWHHAVEMLSNYYVLYRQMENALRVELWQSIGCLSMDSKAPEWKTMRKHTKVANPQALKAMMQQVQHTFYQLLT